MENVEFVSKGAESLNRSLDLPKQTHFTITPRSGSVQMLMCNWEILFCSPFNLALNLFLQPDYLPKVTWENDLTGSSLRDKQGSRAGNSSPVYTRWMWIYSTFICCLREREEQQKLPTCGLRAVSPLIIIISFSYNGCLIKSDSFVRRRGGRGRDKRVPGVFRLRM